jgi:hypothetical protein
VEKRNFLILIVLFGLAALAANSTYFSRERGFDPSQAAEKKKIFSYPEKNILANETSVRPSLLVKEAKPPAQVRKPSSAEIERSSTRPVEPEPITGNEIANNPAPETAKGPHVKPASTFKRPTEIEQAIEKSIHTKAKSDSPAKDGGNSPSESISNESAPLASITKDAIPSAAEKRVPETLPEEALAPAPAIGAEEPQPLPALAVAEIAESAAPFPATEEAQPPASQADKLETARLQEKPADHHSVEPLKTENTEEEGSVSLRLGYGMEYLSFKQAGTLGGIEGGVSSQNSLSLSAKLAYGDWSVAAAFEKYSVKLSADTTNPKNLSEKEITDFSFLPGYKSLFAGLKSSKRPLLRASGTTLDWSDTDSLYAVAGLRLEKTLNPKAKKPFHVSGEIEAGYLLSAGGNGGPQLSNISGYELKAEARAEKAIVAHSDYKLSLGLQGGGTLEKLKGTANWAGTAGAFGRNTQSFGTKIYLNIDF